MTSYEPSRGKPARRSSVVAIVVGVALVVLVLVAAVTSLRSDDDGDQAGTTTSTLDAESTTVVPDQSSPDTSATSSPNGGVTTTSLRATPSEPEPDREAALDKLGAAVPVFGPAPAGDYTMVCAELRKEIGGAAPPNDIPGFIALLDRLDLPKLAVLAPVSVRDSYTTLVDTFPAARIVAEQAANGVPDPDDLPDGFLAAASMVVNVSASKCADAG